ncbi:MAG: carbohydrate kinase [Prevotella sp.]|nr:carbohydrate kinase [Prevotella sp.]
MQYLLGLDIGSSSVKASLVSVETGQTAAQDFMPKQEMPIIAGQAGWAEQNPEDWYANAMAALANCLTAASAKATDITAVGISYQMHGLVLVDAAQNVLRPAIIWCDSRAVPYGQQAQERLGDYCLPHLLNSPGNFTAAKLAWVKDNEPEIFSRIHKFMLPGDYIAMRLTGAITTTVSGLSEGIFWDFKEGRLSAELMDTFGFPADIVPDIVPTFAIQGRISAKCAAETGLKEGTPVCYRGGDQPNNAFSLNVMKPGEIAATGGTSGVVYGVLGDVNYDKLSRVNTFAHVNHSADTTRLGVLLCINGTGILNAWMRRTVAPEGISYAQMNDVAQSVPVGAEGLSVIPFGNGAERVLQNVNTGASIHGINFNIHTKAHVLRAAQEGIAFSFAYGMEIMAQMGMEIKTIKAGHANLFLSPLFRTTLAAVTGATIELYETDGSVGAAKGAGIGAGIYRDSDEAFATLKHYGTEMPVEDNAAYLAAYENWKAALAKIVG